MVRKRWTGAGVGGWLVGYYTLKSRPGYRVHLQPGHAWVVAVSHLFPPGGWGGVVSLAVGCQLATLAVVREWTWEPQVAAACQPVELGKRERKVVNYNERIRLAEDSDDDYDMDKKPTDKQHVGLHILEFSHFHSKPSVSFLSGESQQRRLTVGCKDPTQYVSKFLVTSGLAFKCPKAATTSGRGISCLRYCFIALQFEYL